MTPAQADEDRISRLYQMAINAHAGTAAFSLRMAALDGIHAEAAKQSGVLDWLRARMVLGMEPFTVPGFDGTTWWMVLIRDESISPGGMRGTPAPTVEESAASALVWHLAAVVTRAFNPTGLDLVQDLARLVEREDPLRRVILATVAADPDETAAAYDALTDEDLRLIETYTGAIIRAAVMVGAADRPTRAVSHD